MNDDVNWLITVVNLASSFDHPDLIRCAVQFSRDDFSEDCIEYPMEPENRHAIWEKLPAHVKSCGPIVEIQELFEIKVCK